MSGKTWGLWTLDNVDVHREAGWMENQRPLGTCRTAGVRARKWALSQAAAQGQELGANSGPPAPERTGLPAVHHPHVTQSRK